MESKTVKIALVRLLRHNRLFLVLFATMTVMLMLPSSASALTNGPLQSDDIGDGHGTSHSSTVYYTKQADPFIAWVDRIYYGGRKPSVSLPAHTPQWKRDKTYYKEWNGSRWVTEKRVSASGWQNSGTPRLRYFNLNNDVTLEGGALVKQRLRYRFYVPTTNEFGEWVWTETVEWRGRYHNHFLE